MSEFLKTSLTAAATIIGGVIIFVVSQLFQKLVIAIRFRSSVVRSALSITG